MESFDLLEKMIPMVVFVLWILAALFRQGKKKTVPPPVSSEKKTQQAPPGSILSKVFDELRQSLQSALEVDKEIPPQSSTPAAAENSSDYSHPDSYVRGDISLENMVDEELPREMFPVVKTTSGISAATVGRAQMQFAGKENWRGGSGRFTSRTLRDGILWSEVLQPPIALRD